MSKEQLMMVLVVIFLLFCLWFGAFWLKKIRFARISSKDRSYVEKRWSLILANIGKHPAQAILDADKLLDFMLKIKGYSGSLGQKLRSAESCFSDLNGVWAAHKLRNKLAHEFLDLSVFDAKQALSAFRKAIADLGVDLPLR